MSDTLTITDNRTGAQYEVPVKDGAIRAMDLRKIRTGSDDFGLMAYDPAYLNTASCRSGITFIDGDRGILEYRGYPIDQVAEQSDYLETAHLLLFDRLPTQGEYREWTREVAAHAPLPDGLERMLAGFPRSAHPMGIFMSLVGAMATHYPDGHDVSNPQSRRLQAVRLIAKTPTIAAAAHRYVTGQPLVAPRADLGFVGNFLSMVFAGPDGTVRLDPVLERALDLLFVLHADHEQNCSTSTMRAVGSSQADPYSALAAASAALWGPLHGGANEAVLRMLHDIGTADRVPEFVAAVKRGEGRLMGFGHRVYKSYDPRARLVKQTADAVFEVTGRNRLLDIALELERIALQDEYFVARKLYPNVDFYSGLIYEAMGFPMPMFTVLFAVARTSGWVSQWEEMSRDGEQKITRPRQIYTGSATRPFVPRSARA